MNITEVRVKLLENQPDKLRGFASITIDDFVVMVRPLSAATALAAAMAEQFEQITREAAASQGHDSSGA